MIPDVSFGSLGRRSRVFLAAQEVLYEVNTNVIHLTHLVVVGVIS